MIQFIVWINYKPINTMAQNCYSCKFENPTNTWKAIILTPVSLPIRTMNIRGTEKIWHSIAKK